MNIPSRKAQRNSFAYHRAHLLFIDRNALPQPGGQIRIFGSHPDAGPGALRRLVRAGIHGFEPAGLVS
jgi:hypothetical protein